MPSANTSARTVSVRYSPTEVLRHKDFAAYTNREFDEARKLITALAGLIAAELGANVKVAVTAVMRKLIVTLNAMLRNNQPWAYA